jgi:hypothetical protein
MIAPDEQRIGLELLRLWRGNWRRRELSFVGGSMAPLTDRALGLVISLGDSEPRIGDVILARQRGQLIAHRAVRCLGKENRRWITQGDSCLTPDPEPTPTGEILARVVGIVEKEGIRSLVGPFWTLTGRWAAWQTHFMGRLTASPGRHAGGEARLTGLQRAALALHRRVLRVIFQMTALLEGGRICLCEWQVHAFQSPLWRLLSGSRSDPLPSGDLVEQALRQAEAYGMSLLVLRRVQHLGRLPHVFTSQDLPRREAAAALMLIRRRPRLEETIRTLRRLSIPHMAMKGLAQSLTLYRGDASREMHDVDLLVPAPREEEARQAIQSLGFHVASGPEDPDFPRHHHQAPQVDPLSGLVVEIHREVAPERVSRKSLAEGFWRRADSVEFAGGQLSVPSREDRLLHLCVHLRLHRYLGCLRDVLEVATLTEEDSIPWDWGRVMRVAAEAECLSTLYTGLRLAVLAFGAPVPEEYLEHLSRQLPRCAFRELRIRILARRLTGPIPEKRGRGVSVARWLCLKLAPP